MGPEVLPLANMPVRFICPSSHLPIRKNSAFRSEVLFWLFTRSVTVGWPVGLSEPQHLIFI